MKRLLRAACVALCLLLVAAGCAGETQQEEVAAVTVVVWNYYIGEQKKAFDSMVEQFNQTVGQESGITVEAVSKADIQALNEQLGDAVAGESGAEKPPDIFFAYSDMAYALAQQDLLVDYTAYVPQEVLDTYVPGFLAEGHLLGDSRLYILPAAKSTEVVVVNRTAFDAFCEAVAGDPDYEDVAIDCFETWEGILTAADIYYQWTLRQGLGDQGGGCALFGLDSLSNFLFSSSRQLGHDLMAAGDGNGLVDFDRDVLGRIWDTYYTPMLGGRFAEFGRFRSDDFKTGDILAYLGSVSSAAYLTKEVVDDQGQSVPIEISVLPMPVFADGVPVAIQQGAGMAVLCSEERREHAATVFVTWFTEKEQNMDFSAQSSYLPVRLDAVAELAGRYDTDAGSSVVDMTLETALRQVESGYEMYTPPIFPDSYTVRTVLESTLRQMVEEHRAAASADAASQSPDADTAPAVIDPHKSMEQYIEECAGALSSYPVEVRR